MAIGIHHGPNGSYKSSGVVEDYLIPAMLSGRMVVTNLRGVTRDNCFDVFPDTHPDFDVIYVDTEKREGREKVLRFWHWAPLGALLLFDEAGTQFPKRLRDSDLKKLDLEDFESLGRPFSFNEAFEEHRHYNWDIILMAPNISLIRPDIRATSESAYKHKNRALLGLLFKGTYLLGIHSAETNGTSPSHFQAVNKRKIKDERVFKLYKSTKTGIFKDTINSNSIFKSPRLVLALVVAISAFGYSYYSYSANDAFAFGGKEVVSVADAVPVSVSQKSIVPAVSMVVSNDGGVVLNQSHSLEPFYQFSFIIKGSINFKERSLYLLKATKNGSSFSITSDELAEAGYSVIRNTDCSATVVFKRARTAINCGSMKVNRSLSI